MTDSFCIWLQKSEQSLQGDALEMSKQRCIEQIDRNTSRQALREAVAGLLSLFMLGSAFRKCPAVGGH